ncbi:MAG: DNA alkylation repair protein [Acidimicrobiales bacterium]
MTRWAEDYVAALVAGFEANADPFTAAPMQRYLRDQFPCLGITSPRRRELARDVRSGLARPTEADLVNLVRALWRLTAREYQYVGSDEIRRHAKRLSPAFVAVVEELVTTKSWWDTVDALAVHGAGALVAAHPERRADMDRWLDSDDLWLRRSALLHQLLWRGRTDGDWLFAACRRRADDPDFFIRKAIGWALREYSKTDADAVGRFVAEHDGVLSPLSRREALKRLTSTA